jgi:hypothetical protein
MALGASVPCSRHNRGGGPLVPPARRNNTVHPFYLHEVIVHHEVYARSLHCIHNLRCYDAVEREGSTGDPRHISMRSDGSMVGINRSPK